MADVQGPEDRRRRVENAQRTLNYLEGILDAWYEEGLSLGYLYAEADRRDSAPLGGNAQNLRLEAIEARGDSPSWRAFKLGIVRGYRMSVRTLRGGRWGT